MAGAWRVCRRRIEVCGGCRILAVVPSASQGIASNPLIVSDSEEDCDAVALQKFLDALFDGPEPEIESLGAAGAIRAERVDAQPWVSLSSMPRLAPR